MGTDYSHAHAACCAAQLPAGARVWSGSAAEWETSDYLMAAMEYTLRVIKWMLSEDGQKGVNHPEPLETPAAQAQLEQMVADTRASRTFVDGVLGKTEPRGGD